MRALLDLLLPPMCAGCGREGTSLCDMCQRPLLRRRFEPPGAPLGLPVTMPSGLVQLEWCATYSGAVREAIRSLKYDGERRLIGPLASALADRWARAGAGGEIVTWVPVHPSRRRERGFDQAEELAIAMAAKLGLPALRCLDRRRQTVAQHSLGQAERQDNIGGVFVAAATAATRVRARWVVIVDDVMTTGSTLQGCADALLRAGVAAVSAITVARDR